MTDIELMKKIVPLITCEIPLSQHVCELVFGVNVTNLNSGPKLITSNNQCRATLWVRETCLILGLWPLIIILITASLSSKTYNKAPEPECVVFDGIWTLVCLIDMEFFMFGLTTADGFLHGSLLGPSVLFGTEWNTSITKSQRVRAGIPSMRKPASRGIIFSFCWTVWNWSLFLAQPTCRHERVTSENAQCSSWCWFLVVNVSCKIRVLKQSESAMFGSVSHMTILFVITCMMDVRYETT